MPDSFEVYDYSIEKLQELLAGKDSLSSIHIIKSKLHCHYFKGYFSFIKAKTILVELRYVDHDYLEDFAGYYVKCFKKIPRKCNRLHFFQESFTEEQFTELLSGNGAELIKEKIQDSYLGFIVVKPLPETVVGRACLRTYPLETDFHTRHYPITRSYPVNLFGIELTVNTLAFQEQDKVTSACATSALWSIFQGTGKLFQHAIPSPVEITKAATTNVPIDSRVIPSKGLNAHQMAQAIRNLNLEPLSINVNQISTLKATIYAYLIGKIPLLLTFELFDTTTSPHKSIGHHAVAVAGCGVRKSFSEQLDGSGFVLKAMAVDRLYAHDDQIGPFAKMEVDGGKVTTEQNGNTYVFDSLSTSWRGNNGAGAIGTARAVPDFILIPLQNKIRIPFWTILSAVYNFDNFLFTLSKNIGLPALAGRLEWEIYLTTVNDFKSDFIESDSVKNSSDRFKILTKRMPRFLWVAKSSLACGTQFLDLVFDATGIEQGNLFVRAIEHDGKFSKEMRTITSSGIPIINERLEVCDIIRWFHNHS